ncbi:hypothetical protein DMB92_07445 [Campylobacter sp. MIT 99-7217]|uniref:hypothetical protein n=1 Tax=Campylobacter sp. MIT 99-7217 TaxID=535091 RepID=UPI0011575CCA|nr:hypothetical protein [Campylobacter sp. MIT 99-7217]TQR30643.1 hypothetical protein DMB92_07445 [Campylobacter sp. MIT 99-7217]
MKIAFAKISSSAYPFKLNFDNISFEGELKRLESRLVCVEGLLKGFAYKLCDSCGQELELELNEKTQILASDGIYKDNPKELADVIEFFDGQIDLMEIALNEFESYMSDYFYCEKCKLI